MKEKFKKIITIFILPLFFISYPVMVLADSGLDSTYTDTGSPVGSIISSVFSCLSSLGPVLLESPGSEDYASCHIVIAVICILILYMITAIYIFKIDVRKLKKKSYKFLVSLIPTIIYSLFCFLTEFIVFVYVLVLFMYIIPFVIISKSIINKKLNQCILEAKAIDKEFDEEVFNKEAFNIYKDVQVAWMNFEIESIKHLISEELFNDYQKKLDSLKKKKQKNVLDEIELKSNKIIDMKVEDNIDIIKCHMNVTCYDYIIDDKDHLVKGRKKKKCDYVYELVFNRDMKNNNYILDKKNLKQSKF